MSEHLSQRLMDGIAPAKVLAISHLLEESEGAVHSGICALITTLLAGLSKKAMTLSGASDVFLMLTGPEVDLALPEALELMGSPGHANSLRNAGRRMLSTLFGAHRLDVLGPALADISGLRTSSANSLATLATPLVFGMLKKEICDNGLDAESTASLLAAQKLILAKPLASMTVSPGDERTDLLAKGKTNAAPNAGQARTASAKSDSTLWVTSVIGIPLAATLLWSFVDTIGTKAPVVNVAAGKAMSTKVVLTGFDAPLKIRFDTGKSEISAADNLKIKDAVVSLTNHKGNLVLIGYASKGGGSAVSQELTSRRLLAVAAALDAEGFSSSRIAIKPPVLIAFDDGVVAAEARIVEIRLP